MVDRDKQSPKASKSQKSADPKQDRAAEIIEAGFAEFMEHGFTAARLDSVAKRAGVAKGTIYLYYDSKEALFEAAVKSRITPIIQQAGQLAADHQGSVRELLGIVLDTVYAMCHQPHLTAIVRIIISEGPRFPQILEMYHRDVLGLWRGLLDSIIERGIASGEIEESALTEVPMLVMAPAVMGTLWQGTFGLIEPLPPEKIKAAHLRYLEAGLFGQPK